MTNISMTKSNNKSKIIFVIKHLAVKVYGDILVMGDIHF
jgi:hypothetical protein